MRAFFKKYSGPMYVALITAIMLAILLGSDDLAQIRDTLAALDARWTMAAAGCIFLYLFLRVATLKFYLARRGRRISWLQAAGVTGAGQFYSAITPSASGGQPMQILWLHRLDIPVSLGTACTSAKFLGFQTAMLSLGALAWLLRRDMVAQQLHGLRWLVLLGYAVNSALIAAIVLTLPKTRIMDTLIRLIVRLGEKLHLVKNSDSVQAAFDNAVKDYREALIQLLRKPADALMVFLLSVLQILAYMSVAICLHKAFHLTGTDCVQILTLQLMLFIAAAFIPLPGAAGAQESGFCLFFRGVFPESALIPAMIAWRFFSYYLLMFSGLTMMAPARILSKKNAKK